MKFFWSRLALLFAVFQLSLTAIVNGQCKWTELGERMDSRTPVNISAITKGKDGAIYAGIGHTILKWSGSAWVELGHDTTSLNSYGDIYAIAADSAGNVYAAGDLATSAYNGINYIAKWNGTQWSKLPANYNSEIRTLVVDKAGNVYAGVNLGGACTVIKYTGSTLSTLGGTSSLANGDILAMTIDTANNIYIGGSFNQNFNRYVMKWNGSSWASLNNGSNALTANADIKALITDSAGYLYAGGDFTNGTTGNYTISRWNGTNWTSLGTTGSLLNGAINSLSIGGDGHIYAVGKFFNAGGYLYVARWGGSTWAEYCATGVKSYYGYYFINTLCFDTGGHVIISHPAIASENYPGRSNMQYVARYNGTSLEEMGPQSDALSGFSGTYGSGVIQIKAAASGNIYVACEIGDTTSSLIKFWNGNAWKNLGSTNAFFPSGTQFSLLYLAIDSNENVYCSGLWSNSSTGGYRTIKWNGTNWSFIDSANYTSPYINAPAVEGFAVSPGGDVYTAVTWYSTTATLRQYISKRPYNSTSWQILDSNKFIGLNDHINTIAVSPNNTLYVGGRFNRSNNISLVKWNGSSFVNVGSTIPFTGHVDVSNLFIDDTNNVFTGPLDINTYPPGGKFLAKWNGSAWTYFTNAATPTFYYDDPGYTIAAHAGKVYVSGAIRDNPSGYTLLDNESHNWKRTCGAYAFHVNSITHIIEVDKWGNLYAGGSFTNTRGQNFVATTIDTCQPAVSVIRLPYTVGQIATTFKAKTVYGGGSPHYQWAVNAINAGSDTDRFSYNAAIGDVISCMLTSSALCAKAGNTATGTYYISTLSTPSHLVYQNDNKLLLSPNPAGNNVVLSGTISHPAATYALYIRDLAGQIILTERFVPGKELFSHNISLPRDIANGSYQITITGDEMRTVLPLIILR